MSQFWGFFTLTPLVLFLFDFADFYFETYSWLVLKKGAFWLYYIIHLFLSFFSALILVSGGFTVPLAASSEINHMIDSIVVALFPILVIQNFSLSLGTKKPLNFLEFFTTQRKEIINKVTVAITESQEAEEREIVDELMKLSINDLEDYAHSTYITKHSEEEWSIVQAKIEKRSVTYKKGAYGQLIFDKKYGGSIENGKLILKKIRKSQNRQVR